MDQVPPQPQFRGSQIPVAVIKSNTEIFDWSEISDRLMCDVTVTESWDEPAVERLTPNFLTLALHQTRSENPVYQKSLYLI